jgi:hypothetical protein
MKPMCVAIQGIFMGSTNILPFGNKGFLFEGIHMRDLFATTDKERYKQKELTWLM